MARFKRLTAAEARTLTRSELLDRIEAEQRYWEHRKQRTPGDDVAEREFTRILYASLNPGDGLADALAYLKGERTGPSYWDQKPDVPEGVPVNDLQRAGMATPARVFGPHCSHDECSWVECDLVAPPASGVLYGCRDQADCPYCGPESPDWERLAAEWVRWCVERYGSANSDELRAVDAIPPNVIATAELVEAHRR